jgi:hypothetical protein
VVGEGRTQRKSELLQRFMADGYFLIDTSERPMPNDASPSIKLALLRLALPRLKIRVRELLGDQATPIVLIGGVTHEACFGPFKKEGYHVINDEIIDHPARGGQLRFRTKLRDTLNRIGQRQFNSL